MPLGMSKITDQLTALRKLLSDVEGADDGSFHRVFNAFLDLTEDPELMTGCEPLADDPIRPFIETVLRRFTKDPALELRPAPMFHHGSAGMIHGPVFAGKRSGGFFYFNESHQGLLALTESSGLTHYVRFSTIPVPVNTVIGSATGDYN